MRRFSLLILILSMLFVWSCDDDDTNNDNNNNTNNINCNCGISIFSINDTSLEDVNALVELNDDVDSNTTGFQINIVVAVDDTAECVPENGAIVTLSGGVANVEGTLQNGNVTFENYTIQSGGGILALQATVPNCSSDTTNIMLSTNPIPACTITSGVESTTEYSCPDDDEVPGQMGLQRLITANCIDVAQGTTITFSVEGSSQTTAEVALNGEVEAVVTLPVSAICRPTISVSISTIYEGETITDTVATGEACCLGIIPCNIDWDEDTHYVTNEFTTNNILNMTTDQNSSLADHQSEFTLHTIFSSVDRVSILADDGSGTYTEICGSSSLTSDNVSLSCTVPDGTIALKPVCYTSGETDYFEDLSQNHLILVDTIAPQMVQSFDCSVTNTHEVDISCSWILPGVSGDESIFDTVIKYTDSYDSNQCATDESNTFSSGWASLPLAPGYSTMETTGAAGESKNHIFTPFVPDSGYCIGNKVMDMAGNYSTDTSLTWVGNVYPNTETINGVYNKGQFSTSMGSSDLNCDGLKDLIVGAPVGYDDAACVGGFCTGDGKVFIYFAQAGGGYPTVPDVTITHDIATFGQSSYMTMGWSVAGIGNFSRHIDDANSNDSIECEDIAFSSLEHANADWLFPGAVFILKGRTDWSNMSEITTAVDQLNGVDAIINYVRTDGAYADPITAFMDPPEYFGSALAPIGDFNGDGFGDFAISAPGALPAGAVYGLFSSTIPFKNGTDAPTTLSFPDDSDFQLLGGATIVAPTVGGNGSITNYGWIGRSLSALGDINNDGFDDMLIGAPGCGGRWGLDSAPGKVFMLMGGSGDVIDSKTYSGTRLHTITQDTGSIEGTQCFGWAVAGIGDFNDDGFLDFAISDLKYDLPASAGTDLYEGAVFVFFGNANPIGNLLTSNAGMKLRSEWQLTSYSDYFGMSVAPSVNTVNTNMGDFNNDGITDLLVGTQHFGDYHGSMFVWYGDSAIVEDTSSTSWSTYEQATFWFIPPTDHGFWGENVKWLGDINDDGYSDIVVGDSVWGSLYGGGTVNELKGRVTVIY
jgi:FG-GAP repeat